MTELQNPKFLIDEVAKLGVQLPTSIKFDAEAPLVKLSEQFKGTDPSFGEDDINIGDSDFGSFLRHIIGRKADRAVTKVVKVGAKVGAIASFAIPGVGPLVGTSAMAALAAGDKLLGDPKVKSAAKVVSNTKAMAALGNQSAKRGAMVLAAVQKIRTAKKVPIGKSAIPYVGTINPKKYTQKTTQSQAYALAQKKIAEKPKITFWVKVKKWLGFKV